MSIRSSICRRIGSLAACSLLLAQPAQAALENTLAHLPGGASGAVVLQTDAEAWSYFSARKPFSNWQQLPEVQEWAAQLKQAGFEPDKDLLPYLGSHLVLAYYPETAAPQRGTLLGALDLKSDTAAQAVQARLQELLKGRNEVPLAPALTSRGCHRYGSEALSEKLKALLPMPDGHFAYCLQDQTLLLVLGETEDFLQPLQAGTHLADNPAFSETAAALKDQQAWLFIDQTGLGTMWDLLSAIGADLDETLNESGTAPKDSSLTRETLLQNLQGLGVGLELGPHGLGLKLFAPYSGNMSPALQAYFASLQPDGGPGLSGLWPFLPEKPLLVLAGQKLDTYLREPIPPFAGEAFDQMRQQIAAMRPEIGPAIQKVTGLDMEKDLLAHLDGRYALIVDPATKDTGQEAAGGGTSLERWYNDPSTVLLLGTRPETREAFFALLDKRLKLVPGALEDPQAIARSKVFENMNRLTLQLFEYGYEHKGYPAKLATALASPSMRPAEIVNPLNGHKGQGIGKAMLDYQVWRNYKPQAGFAGMVFYAPVGKPHGGRYPGFRVYGYAPDGSLWVIDDQKGERERVALELPKREIASKLKALPIQRLNYGDQVIRYVDPSGKGEGLRPAWTRAGDFLALSLDTGSLAHLLDRRGNGIGTLLSGHGANSKNLVAYLDLRQLQNIFASLRQDSGQSFEALENDEILQMLGQALDYLYFEQGLAAGGQGGKIFLGIDMDKLDFEKIAVALADLEINLPRPSQPLSRDERVKTNMHTLQIMIETYGVDWGGNYPESLEGLHREAVMPGREYWKDFSNPYTSATGIGPRGSLIEFKDFTPTPELAGLVVFQPLCGTGSCVEYDVYGIGENGELLPGKGGSQPFKLSNDEAYHVYEPELEGEPDLSRNLHALQVMVETYAVDWGGIYPPNLDALYAEAIVPGREYWKALRRPGTGAKGIGARGAMLDIGDYYPDPSLSGLVIYEPITYNGSFSDCTKYFIYGVGPDGGFFKDPKHPKETLFLSNS